jgi:hypothetical protein
MPHKRPQRGPRSDRTPYGPRKGRIGLQGAFAADNASIAAIAVSSLVTDGERNSTRWQLPSECALATRDNTG